MSSTRRSQLFYVFLWGVRVAQSFVFCPIFYRSLFIILLFSIVLSVRRFTACDYPVDIIKPFLPTVIVDPTESILFYNFIDFHNPNGDATRFKLLTNI